MANKQLYISDQTEAQPYSQKFGQVQYLQADKKKGSVKSNIKNIISKKMK